MRARGDDALIDLTRQFNHATLTAKQFAVTQAEFVAAALRADDDLREVVSTARRNIEAVQPQSASARLVDAQLRRPASWVRNSILFNASASTCPAAQRRSSRPRS